MTLIETKEANYHNFFENAMRILDNSYVQLDDAIAFLRYREGVHFNSISDEHMMFHISDESYSKLSALLKQQEDLEEVLNKGEGFIPSSCSKCNIFSMLDYYITHYAR